MSPIAIFCVLTAVLMSTGVDCGYAQGSSSSSSNSDGSGHTFTSTNNDGQGSYVHTAQKPGGAGFTTTGNVPIHNNPGLYGPQNFGQPGFGFNYGPAYPYNPYGNTPQYNPAYNPSFNQFPQQSFGFNAPFAPLPPFQPIQPLQQFSPYTPLASPQEFNQYLNGIQQQYATGGSVAQSTPGATAFASSYLGPNKYYKQQQELLNAWKSSQFQSGYGGVPNYAYATGTYGPSNQFHQTAGVYPPNKNNPNLDSRFDGSAGAAGNAPGYFGISTSSFSSASDVNGIKKHKEGAQTTVNDNGKVSTYAVEN